jgi:carbon-monoxide dehydrogenase iron sulfur subunit
MKRIYVNEKWCLGCRLCEYNCAFANSAFGGGKSAPLDMSAALKDKKIYPNIRIESAKGINFAVSCRHCADPYCVKSCISGAMQRKDGVISVDQNKCVHCYTCIVACPYGAISPSEGGVIQKCELCLNNTVGEPACVKGCINQAIVFEERN